METVRAFCVVYVCI